MAQFHHRHIVQFAITDDAPDKQCSDCKADLELERRLDDETYGGPKPYKAAVCSDGCGYVLTREELK